MGFKIFYSKHYNNLY